nr:GDSL esterase/lipase At1g09390-like [Ipomoea batatas]
MLSQVDFAGALYTIDIGQNDLSGAFTENKLSVPEVMANIPSFISEIKTAIEMGCLIHLNEVANEFNTRLGKLCELMRSELNESVIVYVDIYTIKYNVISNYVLYGFESLLMACCGGGGAPYNANVWCGLKGSNLCEKEKRYISWDGIHYTERANTIFAAQIASRNYSTPPLEFDYFCS